MKEHDANTKKAMILEIAENLSMTRFTPAEIEQIRRQMVARFGIAAKTSPDYIVAVLVSAGLRVVLSTKADTEGRYEEEFQDLLHFSDLEEAEMCLMRLDELLRKFRSENDPHAVERVLEVARLGRRRAEMISRNPKVEARKRAEKEEVLQWFSLWLETPDTFFDWLELRKQSPGFRKSFGATAAEA